MLLLHTGQLGFGYLSADWESTDSNAAAVKELRDQGLVVLEKTSLGAAYPLQYSLTAPAKRAYEAVLSSLISQVASGASAPGTK